MIVNMFGNDPQAQQIQERIAYWFDYISNVCSASESCEVCQFVGGQQMQTDMSVLCCETGANKKPKGD